MVRPPFVDSNGMRKGAWSEEEDNKLRAYIQRYGHWNWRLLPKYAGLSRCGKSCRLRWVNYLKPGVKKGNFTNEEEDLIIELHMQLGNKWSAIAAKLPGRTDNEIKNFWHTRVEKRLKRNPPAKKNDVGHTTIEASSKDEEFNEDDNKFSKNTLCKTAQNESAAYLDWPTSSFDNNPSVLSITEPGPVDSWPDTFLPDTAYSPISDYFPPLREEDFFYPEFHYNDLSSSDSSYNNLTGFDWINGVDDDHNIISSDNYVAQTDLWSESFAANASSSQSESSYNIPSQEVGAGAYDPFFHEYFDHGMNLFS